MDIQQLDTVEIFLMLRYLNDRDSRSEVTPSDEVVSATVTGHFKEVGIKDPVEFQDMMNEVAFSYHRAVGMPGTPSDNVVNLAVMLAGGIETGLRLAYGMTSEVASAEAPQE